jgi:hypothetical protein
MVDLNNCVCGDILISSHGMKLMYIKKFNEDDYYEHLVMYPDGTFGTRCNDGFAYRNPSRRLETDHDIVKIINQNKSLEERYLIDLYTRLSYYDFTFSDTEKYALKDSLKFILTKK